VLSLLSGGFAVKRLPSHLEFWQQRLVWRELDEESLFWGVIEYTKYASRVSLNMATVLTLSSIRT